MAAFEDQHDLKIYPEEKRMGAHLCPVCGKFKFLSDTASDICDVCGWESDPMQDEDHDVCYCRNNMSVNKAKKAYAEGKPVY